MEKARESVRLKKTEEERLLKVGSFVFANMHSWILALRVRAEDKSTLPR
jgi:hypothetical protein